jgi:hypothetical protein
MPNRLAQSSSPYLRQHAENPVDWYEWNEETWALAKAQDKPVFLSVGYSSCHWCHVMAHESFQDEEVARVLNAGFINIKLDREERPDVDEVYMTAVQMATGQGGWPMSIWLTPDKKPFFVGTYFPRQGRGEFPGFLSLAANLASAWRDQRDEVTKAAEDFAENLQAVLQRGNAATDQPFGVDIVDRAVEALHHAFDDENGGFSVRPKFPPHADLGFLREYHSRRGGFGGDANLARALTDQSVEMRQLTLVNMALGGLRDHVGGGFHRYATDGIWLLPHFEKMLYDNAQLLREYAWAASDPVFSDAERALFAEARDGIVGWLKREMTLENGMFASAQDADSLDAHGHMEEGAFYVWSQSEAESMVGDAVEMYQFRPEGNFRDESTQRLMGTNIPHLVEIQLRDPRLDALLQARASRPRPLRDDKALASWNAMMISGLVAAGALEVAIPCAQAWLAVISPAGHLPHQVMEGRASGIGFLDDYAHVADAFLDLAEATDNPEWREKASSLAHQMVEYFALPEGGFAFTGSAHETLFGRTRNCLDNATPAGPAVALRVLRRLDRTTELRHHLGALYGWADRIPTASGTLLTECLAFLQAHGSDLQAPQAPAEAVQVHLAPAILVPDEEGWAHTTVEIMVAEGYHINSHAPSTSWLIPTVVRVEGAFAEAGLPDDAENEWTGTVEIPLRLRPKGTGPAEFTVSVTYQACQESACLAPNTVTLTGQIL